ncbi:MAG: hypothetical protein HQ575_07515 [Candidatus Omnitrophica bacterium]|nr:hypothetical protein [Candidatus Omnitrophota bacterium]
MHFKSLACGVASFLSGVFLDIDHIFDCYLNHGRDFKLSNLYRYCMEVRFDKLTLFLHSYELLAVFWVLIYLFSMGDIWKALAIGATQHILFDQVFNKHHADLDWRAYFLTHRLMNRFKKEAVIRR